MPTDHEEEVFDLPIEDLDVREYTEPKKVKPGLEKATDEQCEDFVDALLVQYPTMVEKCSHWSSSLVAIINKLKYKPGSRVCAYPNSYDSARDTAISIVQRQVTPKMLDDIARAAKVWAENNLVRTVGPDDVTTHDASREEPKPVRVRSGSESLEGWGSW